jgi:iron complex transport system substrate-binding protein
MLIDQAMRASARRLPARALLLAGFAACAAACMAASAAATAGATTTPIVLRDDLQREMRFAQPPQRIVTLLPSLTELICALDACGRLVATDDFSNWPEGVRSLPKAGGLDNAQIELIVSLKPDVVILSRVARVTERLKELGVASFVIETETFDDIGRAAGTLGTLLGTPQRAAALNLEIEQSVDAVAQQARRTLGARSPRVYYEVDGAPYAAGPASFIGTLLSRLGARNIIAADLGPFPALNPEFVVLQDPDVIFASPNDAVNLARRPGWDRIRAVREHRVCAFPPAVRDTIVRPGPRVADGMRAIADCLGRVAP